MQQVFIGYDPRQPISYNVAHHSLITHSTKPTTVCPLILEQLPIEKVGLTPFTFTRWLVPWLMCFGEDWFRDRCWALFLDADVVVAGDVSELFDMADESFACMVSKNVKQFEWPAVVLWNCGHEANKKLTPEHVENGKPYKWDWLGGFDSPLIGSLPGEWNHLVGYDEPNPNAKLIHFTAGIPPFPETQCSEHADTWAQEHQNMSSAIPWVQLMGNSVHATHLPDGRVLPHFHPEVLKAKQAAAEVVE